MERSLGGPPWGCHCLPKNRLTLPQGPTESHRHNGSSNPPIGNPAGEESSTVEHAQSPDLPPSLLGAPRVTSPERTPQVPGPSVGRHPPSSAREQRREAHSESGLIAPTGFLPFPASLLLQVGGGPALPDPRGAPCLQTLPQRQLTPRSTPAPRPCPVSGGRGDLDGSAVDGVAAPRMCRWGHRGVKKLGLTSQGGCTSEFNSHLKWGRVL